MKKRTIKKLLAVSLSLAMVLGMAACGSSGETTESAKTEEAAGDAADDDTAEEDTAEPAEASKDEKITVGVNLYYRRDEYYADLESTFKQYGEELGYEVVVTDADGDVTTQIHQVEDFVTQGVDAILIAVADPDALIPPIQAAVDAGIPVICYDGGIASDDIAATKCIFDYPENGAILGEWVKEYVDAELGGKAKIAIVDFPPSAAVGLPTVQGFIDSVSQHEGIEIVAQQDGKASRTDSMAVMETILMANQDLDLVYAFNLDMAIGCANAIEANGNSDAIVCGGGWGQEGFEMLESGHPILKALCTSSPVTQARDAMDAVAPALAGEELPAETLSHGELLTQENIKDFDWRSVVDARSN